MKKVLLAFVLLMFVGSYTLQMASATAETKRDSGYISLNGTKYIDVDPNIARITFAVENYASSAQTASKENNEVSNKIINALKNVTDTKTDMIKTANFSIRPIYYTNKDGKRIIKNYMAVNSVNVQTKNIKNVSTIIDTAINNGANRTDGLVFSFEDDNSMCKELYPQVMSSLKSQASILAQAAGTSLDGIKYINASCSTDSPASNSRVYLAKSAMADGAMEEAVSTPIEAGKAKVRVYVNVDFYVK